jgi:hypothetical protein
MLHVGYTTIYFSVHTDCYCPHTTLLSCPHTLLLSTHYLTFVSPHTVTVHTLPYFPVPHTVTVHTQPYFHVPTYCYIPHTTLLSYTNTLLLSTHYLTFMSPHTVTVHTLPHFPVLTHCYCPHTTSLSCPHTLLLSTHYLTFLSPHTVTVPTLPYFPSPHSVTFHTLPYFPVPTHCYCPHTTLLSFPEVLLPTLYTSPHLSKHNYTQFTHLITAVLPSTACHTPPTPNKHSNPSGTTAILRYYQLQTATRWFAGLIYSLCDLQK